MTIPTKTDDDESLGLHLDGNMKRDVADFKRKSLAVLRKKLKDDGLWPPQKKSKGCKP